MKFGNGQLKTLLIILSRSPSWIHPGEFPGENLIFKRILCGKILNIPPPRCILHNLVQLGRKVLICKVHSDEFWYYLGGITQTVFGFCWGLIGITAICGEFFLKISGYDIDFHLFLTTFYGELGTVIEAVWIRAFPCDNPGSGRKSNFSIFWDRRTRWSKLRYVD